jgi:hypothetical protein
MGLWKKFRDRASRKEERSHFGLAWSVFAAYWLAAAILLRTLHESGWLVNLADIGVLLFFIFGGFGVYFAFAVPLRIWPHHPKKKNQELFNAVGEIFVKGYILSDQWGKWTVEGNQPWANDRANSLMSTWIPDSESQIKDLLGEDEYWRYRFSEDLLKAAPPWAEESLFPGLWQRVQGRLAWIKTWMDSQLDL